MDTKELAWASGLFEGEGSISLSSFRGDRPRYAGLELGSTDEATLLRFQTAIGGGGRIYVRHPSGIAKKTLYLWRSSSFELSQAVIAMLWYGLGERRRDRCREVLAASKDSQTYRKNMPRGKECSVADCHDPVLARGLCSRDYQRARHAKA